MRRVPLRRKVGIKPSRKPLGHGKRHAAWITAKQPTEEKLFLENLTFCLVCSSTDCTPAHVWRRWHSNKEMLAVFAPLCATCHQRIDLMGEYVAFVLLTYLLWCAEHEREPEILVATASDADIVRFVRKQMSEEEFWTLRREMLARTV